MIRRNFIKNTSLALTGCLLGNPSEIWKTYDQDLIIGHGTHRYKIDLNWGALNAQYYPVKDCHEMVQDSQGRIIMLTNHTKNNVIIYDQSGELLEVWGTEFPGAHGLSLQVEGGEDFLYLTDCERHEVIKTTLTGKIVLRLPYPKASGKYKSASEYLPTETAIAENGDIYVADGYGLQYIIHYDARGKLLNIFGGKGTGAAHFDNAHGICIDDRQPKNKTLLITARQQNKLKRFSLSGEYIESIDLPGAYICRPVIHKKEIYLATIWSGNGSEGTGFISILNEHNQLISAPGACQPRYENDKLQPMYQTLKVFTHPHDVCVDQDDNLYVPQWNARQTYPLKLIRV
ncbi:MAG: 6-bladed beta-propeller [Saprospiraceae bacterium]